MATLQQKLEKLYTLLNSGAVTEVEFNRRKALLVEEFVSGDSTAGAVDGSLLASGELEEEVPEVIDPSGVEFTGPKVCCKLRGLPFTASVAEVAAFLDGLKIDWDHGGIKLVMEPRSDNICSGIGYARFVSEAEAQQAVLLKDRQPIGHRYVEVILATTGEMDAGLVPRRSRKDDAFPGRFAPYPAGKGKGKGMFPGKGKGMGMGVGVGVGMGSYGVGPGSYGAGAASYGAGAGSYGVGAGGYGKGKGYAAGWGW